MKILLNKTIIYFSALLMLASVCANAQSKVADMKRKNNFIMHMKQNQNLKNPGQKFGIKINPYWEDVNAPHTSNSFIPQIKVPSFNAVWGKVDYDSVPYDANQFLRTADGGKTWRLDSIDAPNGYGLSSISPIDANTCYAAMYNAFVGLGGGVFKTTDGGSTWQQLKPGELFSQNSFPDIVYFFDAQHGVTVGDDDGTDTSRLEIYTTGNAGKTWQRVSKENIPPTAGYAFSSNFNSYTVFQNRLWFRAGDSYGNSYIYRSDDFGQHWQQFSYTLATSISDFAFIDKQNGLGVSFNFGVGPLEVETHDGGATWSNKSFMGYPMGLSIAVIPFTHTFVSTIPYGVTPVGGSSYSNDFGATWKLIDSSSDARHFSVAFLNPLIGWSGRANSDDLNGGVYKWKLHFSLDNDATTTDDAVSSDKTISLSKNNTIHLSTYPNPVSNTTNISFSLSQSQKVSIQVYDGGGRLVKNIANTQMQAGTHQLIWNASDEKGTKVATGMYYLKFNAGNYVETKKISVIK